MIRLLRFKKIAAETAVKMDVGVRSVGRAAGAADAAAVRARQTWDLLLLWFGPRSFAADR